MKYKNYFNIVARTMLCRFVYRTVIITVLSRSLDSEICITAVRYTIVSGIVYKTTSKKSIIKYGLFIAIFKEQKRKLTSTHKEQKRMLDRTIC